MNGESYYPAHASIPVWFVVPDPRPVEVKRRSDPVYLGRQLGN